MRLLVLLFALLSTIVYASDYKPSPNYITKLEHFIPQARSLWKEVLIDKANIAQTEPFDKNQYCSVLHDMMNRYPDPKLHIFDYIFTRDDGRADLFPDLQFMHDIHHDLLWAFESDYF